MADRDRPRILTAKPPPRKRRPPIANRIVTPANWDRARPRIRRALGDAVHHGDAALCRTGVRATAVRSLPRSVAEIHSIFADCTALVEPLSLDEAYLDVTEDWRGLSSASATAKEIRTRIFNQTSTHGLSGVSYDKFLANLASTQRKPNSQFVIIPEMGPDFVALLPVRRFHGVGPVIAAKMQRLGIQAGADCEASRLGFCNSISANRRRGIL